MSLAAGCPTPARSGEAAGTVPVVLASASKVRATLLRAAGVTISVDPAMVDEAEVKQSLRAAGAPSTVLAETLAELKAQRTSRRHSGALVIGADQVLDCHGSVFDKATSLAEAKACLMALRGRRHELVCGVVIARDGVRLWHHIGRAGLTMRSFSEAFVDGYLSAVGETVLASVGAYQLEAVGAQLFSHVDGDYFTILGLPLLPVLDFLRTHGALPS